ncbi:unnamed protein product [Rhizophagus irregularis]|nr:unnamed protein product [Rhizophagus irregularis]
MGFDFRFLGFGYMDFSFRLGFEYMGFDFRLGFGYMISAFVSAFGFWVLDIWVGSWVLDRFPLRTYIEQIGFPLQIFGWIFFRTSIEWVGFESSKL